MLTRRVLLKSVVAGLMSVAMPLTALAQGKNPDKLRVALLPDEKKKKKNGKLHK